MYKQPRQDLGLSGHSSVRYSKSISPQGDAMLVLFRGAPTFCRHRNVVRTSVTNSAIASCATVLILPHFDVVCA